MLLNTEREALYCTKSTCIEGARTVVFLCLMMIFAFTVSYAQVPTGVLTPIAPAKEPAQERPSEEAVTVELGDKRAKAETELKAVTANTASDVPQEKLLERRSLLEQVVRGYDEQIVN